MSAAVLMALAITAAALPVLWRVGRIVAHMSRCHFSDPWRFQGFAIGYALLGALTAATVLDAWAGNGAHWREIGFVAASALLIVFDRRRRG